MFVGGIVMVTMGGLAALDTRLVGVSPNAFISMNATHGGVHAIGGLLALAAWMLLIGRLQAYAILGYGTLFVLGFILNVVSPDFFGMMTDAPANVGVHVMHATVATLSLGAASSLFKRFG